MSGTDSALFSIDATGSLSFIAAPDFETNPGPFNVTVTATDDGEGTLADTQNLTINVTNVNEAPVLDLDANDSSTTGSGFITSFTEGNSPAFIADVDVAISDIDDAQIESATITINGVEAGDLLIVGSLPGGITASAYNPSTGVLNLSGSASLANYQAAIRAIQFSNDGSSVAASRDIDVVVNDGDVNSNVATTTINITTVPTVSITDVSVQEPAAGTTLLVFTVAVDELLGSDLTFDIDTADISALAGSDYVGVSGGSATINAGSNSTTIEITINSDANNFEGDETFGLNLSNFNQTVNFVPTAHLTTDGIQGLGTIGANNGAPTANDDSFVTDPDTVFVTGNVLANDELVDNAVVSSSDTSSAQGGTVSYNGDGTFTYTPASAFIGTDTFTYTLTDDDGETSIATVTIEVTDASVNGPNVSNVPDSSYTENASAISLLAGVSLSDIDSASLSSVVVEISGYIPAQDVLDYLTAGTSVNASVTSAGNTWTLTLTGGADINEYLTVLNTVSYENDSENPSTAARTVTVTAYDQQFNNVFTSDSGTLSVVAVNDAPVVNDNAVFTVENSDDNTLNITAPTDFDDDDATLLITVTGIPSTIGTVTLADGSAVMVGQVLSLNQLTNLQFDANAVQGAETLTYTVSDGEETTVGTTTIDVGTTNPDVNTVYESGLASGTQTGDALATGNLLDNDAIGSTSIDSVVFNGTTFTAVGGVITVDTPLGELTVYADNSTAGRSVGDYEYQLQVADGSSNDVTEEFSYNFTNGASFSDNLTITIVDDQPIANNLAEDIPESEEKVFNLVFSLDVSTSMNAEVGSTGQSRLDLAKQSLVALADEYFNQSTQVSLTVLLFADGAHELGTYSNFAAAQAAITGVTDNTQTAYPNDVGGGNLTDSTSYVDALTLIENVFTTDINGQSPTSDVQNISYFLSDGAITADGSPIGNGFDIFVNNNSIDSYSVGIGTGLPGDLSDLNYIHNIDSLGQGGGHVDPALIVSDVSLLESELLSTVPTAFGGSITFNGSIPNILFGADDGYVQSITLTLDSGTQTFTFNGSTITAPGGIGTITGSQLTLSSSTPGDGFDFGTFTFDFADGTYLFSAPNGTAPSSFDFVYTVLDGDGDSATATATINIVDDSPDAHDDLHSTSPYQTAEGNVVTAIGTDGGPDLGAGFTPFASQGSGVDKIVDDATVTEFSYKGSIIDLDLALVAGPAPSGLSANAVINSSTDFSILDFSLSSASGVGFNGSGAGVSGGRANSTLDDQDGGTPLTITFDSADLPYGVENLVLGLSDFQSSNSDAVLVTLFDVDGNTIDQVSHQASSGSSVDLSAYGGIASVDIAYSGGGFDAQLNNVAYDPAPAPQTLVLSGGDNGSNLTWVYSYEQDNNGNDIFQATVTDSNDGSVFTMRSNGYYHYDPDPTLPDPVEVFLDPVSLQATTDAGVALSSINGPINYEPGLGGAGVDGAGNDSAGISVGESMNIDFTVPYGAQGILLDFSFADPGEMLAVAIFDVDGNLIVDGLTVDASSTVDLSAYDEVGRVTVSTIGTASVLLDAIRYTPFVPPNPQVAPVTVEYTLTDSDGQSDSAQLAIYSIDNTITGTAGTDNITGGADNDAITGDAGDDLLSGGAGHDNIAGGAGLDLLVGGLGDDYLAGGDDADDLQGGVGNDHLSGDAGDDLLDGEEGDDILLGGAGDDRVFGGAGNDRLEGGEGDDQLFGGSGDDLLKGGDGDDIIRGGQGDDQLLGGLGVDVFTWSFGDGGDAGTPAVDTISDFNAQPASAGGDVLDLRDLLVGESESTLSDFLHIETQGSNTVISVSTSGTFGDGFDVGEVNQQIVIEGVDLLDGFVDQNALIQDLITNGKLITD